MTSTLEIKYKCNIKQKAVLIQNVFRKHHQKKTKYMFTLQTQKDSKNRDKFVKTVGSIKTQIEYKSFLISSSFVFIFIRIQHRNLIIERQTPNAHGRQKQPKKSNRRSKRGY